MRRRSYVAGAMAVLLASAALYESVIGAGRGWWRGESFYQHRPTSYWRQKLMQSRIGVYT
jgi:hypothetical protein